MDILKEQPGLFHKSLMNSRVGSISGCQAGSVAMREQREEENRSLCHSGETQTRQDWLKCCCSIDTTYGRPPIQEKKKQFFGGSLFDH